MTEKRSWFASGKERKPGNLLKYTFIVLTGVVFAVVALVLLYAGAGRNAGSAILWGIIAAAITAAVGVIIFFIYTRLLVKK